MQSPATHGTFGRFSLRWKTKKGSVPQGLVLESLERLSQGASNLRFLATSREVREVRDSIETLGANPIATASRSVEADI